jgi:glucan phosphoethanolaminetransferase (alkaline phosphatase superfamily)
MNKEKKLPKTPAAPINYIFFGCYFLIIAAVHVFHVFLVEPIFSQSTYLFATFAIAQCALETLLLIFFAGLIQTSLPRFLNLYAVIVFFLFLGHLIDFPLERLMDMSFWQALHFMSQESYENFVELLLATNVSMFIWMLAGMVGICVLLSGTFIYRLSARWAAKRRIALSSLKLISVIGIVIIFFLGWDHSMKGRVSSVYFDRFEKTLPWKSTFFPQKVDHVVLKNSLQEPDGEEELMRKLDSRIFSLTHKPDIYLFVVESLREDYITSENTPHLQRFKEKNIAFESTFSNANATHISWFSLFHSKFPFYWGKIDPEVWKGGSMPLRLLKKMGYKIHVASSARLTFYQMNRLIFGEGEHLADSIFFPDEEECNENYLRDQSTIGNTIEQMGKGGSGRLFIVFLEATHFDYSWPREQTLFMPFVEKINYFKAALGKRAPEQIINRYKNALHFVDSQFGIFLEALEKTSGGKDAVVVITGDHGEEFYEQGNLFHASALSQPQITPPLYYKFGESPAIKETIRCKMTCHMDIFPTLFHYLAGEDLMAEVLQGQSIFKSDKWPYTLIARYNASRTPYEYCIHNGTEKIIMQFCDKRNICNARSLKILSKKNNLDENLTKEPEAIQAEFGPAFDRIFYLRP